MMQGLTVDQGTTLMVIENGATLSACTVTTKLNGTWALPWVAVKSRMKLEDVLPGLNAVAPGTANGGDGDPGNPGAYTSVEPAAVIAVIAVTFTFVAVVLPEFVTYTKTSAVVVLIWVACREMVRVGTAVCGGGINAV